jgi:hypothetical protein
MTALYTAAAAAARQLGRPQPFTCACCQRPIAERRPLWLVRARWLCSRCFLAVDEREIPATCTHWSRSAAP